MWDTRLYGRLVSVCVCRCIYLAAGASEALNPTAVTQRTGAQSHRHLTGISQGSHCIVHRIHVQMCGMNVWSMSVWICDVCGVFVG